MKKYIFFVSLVFLTKEVDPSRKLPISPPESLVDNELTAYPTIATYISQNDPRATFDAGDVLKVDESPKFLSLLRFDNLPPSVSISNAVLTLLCTDSSWDGGTIFKMQQLPNYGTSWSDSPHRDGRGLRKVAKIGRVKRGRTYQVDISRAFKGRSSSGDGGALGLIIESRINDGARYSKESVRLDFTLKTGGKKEQDDEDDNDDDDDDDDDDDNDPGMTGGGGGRGPFQIMLWFDPDYMWQETSAQKSWCVQCSRRTVSRKSKSKNKEKQLVCEDGNTVRINECDDDDKLQWWTWENGMFRAYTNRGLCWDYEMGKNYHVRSCGSSSYQTFGSGPAPNEFNTNGNFERRRFELYPKQTPGKCVTQEHHPKAYELLKSQSCETARRHKTSYWIATNPPNLSGHSLDD